MASQEWIERQARDAVKRARERMGAGWSVVGTDVREALVCHQLVLKLISQDDSLHEQPIGTWVAMARLALVEAL